VLNAPARTSGAFGCPGKRSAWCLTPHRQPRPGRRLERDTQRRELCRRPMAPGAPDEASSTIASIVPAAPIHRSISSGGTGPKRLTSGHRLGRRDRHDRWNTEIAIRGGERAPLGILEIVAPHRLRAFAPERDRFRRRRDHSSRSVRVASRHRGRSARQRFPARLVAAGPSLGAPRAGRGLDVLCLESGHRGRAPTLCAPGPRTTGFLTRALSFPASANGLPGQPGGSPRLSPRLFHCDRHAESENPWRVRWDYLSKRGSNQVREGVWVHERRSRRDCPEDSFLFGPIA